MNKENLDFEARQTLEDLSIPKEKRDTEDLLDILCPRKIEPTDRELLFYGDDNRWD